MFTAFVITVSDKGSTGERIGRIRKSYRRNTEKNGYEVLNKIIIPDEREIIEEN